MRMCKICGRTRSLPQFYKSSTCKRGRGSICIPCMNKRRWDRNRRMSLSTGWTWAWDYKIFKQLFPKGCFN